MDYKEKYKECYQNILREHEQVFQQLDLGQMKNLMDAIVKADRVFLHGTGREGISLRGFAMRLAHLGKAAYWLFDDTTVGMHEGDLFIIADGRGDVGIHRRIVEQAVKTKAKIAFLTCLPEGNLVKNYADLYLFVHATVYMGDSLENPDAPVQHDVVPTKQPMGNQFEQHLYLLLDVISILLKDALGQTDEEMENRHRNIE